MLLLVRKKKLPSPNYTVFALTSGDTTSNCNLQDYIVRMDNYDIPQARHRLILLGVRSDILNDHKPDKLKRKQRVSVDKVLAGLPKLRSGLSKEHDDSENWIKHLKSIENSDWFSGLSKLDDLPSK